ncbi:MAG: amino acid permease [Chitinivibrionales bacterium]|nr:amino acid permease [Chitinivibrionales bacterium]MBD3397334.1 amino acid permease [Chitinivibrionales bacterium]
MKRTLGLTSVFCISAGAMISSGLFVLPGLAFARAGPAVFLSYFAAGCVALTTVLSLSELVTAMPRAGGDYFYVSRSFGSLFGTVSGLLSWFALSLKSAFAIFGIAELVYLAFGIHLTVSAIILTLVFTALNLAGVREAARVQITLVIGLFAILGGFFVIGMQDIVIQRFEPFLSHGYNAMLSTSGFVFVSFGGVLTAASIAGEVRNPSRTIPAGLIGSTIAVTILYAAITLVVVGLVPAGELRDSLAPIASAAQTAGGAPWYWAVMLASLFAFVTTANGGILTASRYPIALGSDGMLPAAFARVTGARQTPVVSILATGALIAMAVLLDLDILIKAASTVILLSNIFAHLSVIVMRESMIATYRPTYKAPLYPWLQIGGIAAFILLIVDMGMQPILFSLLFVSIGVILYFTRKGGKERVSAAIIHVVQRITNKELVTDGLQSELRAIVADRDRIVKDAFDDAVESACHLEIEERCNLESLWNQVAGTLENCLSSRLPAASLAALLRRREAESSTAISRFVAIPHVIVEGEGIFQVVFVRARDGVHFNADHPAVRAIFVLLGSKDMRNLHLRALAAIAQVVQHGSFEKAWMRARNERELKDLFLLSKRSRPAG